LKSHSGAWVLDAGVAAKWYLDAEPLAAHAVGVLGGFQHGDVELLVPDLFWPEFGNVLWKAVRHGRIAPADAKRAIASLTSGILPTVPSMPLLKDAFSLAHATGRTVYDATYVMLAIETGRELLTADERLVNALRTRYPVRWLGSLVF
jgi:predicted nucleic acid-binding protein